MIEAQLKEVRAVATFCQVLGINSIRDLLFVGYEKLKNVIWGVFWRRE